MIGEIEGINPGTLFKGRKELHAAGVHCGLMVGIAAKGGESIVLSGGYKDDKDEGDVIIYTGEGGRDAGTGRQIADQNLTRGNLALYNHCAEKGIQSELQGGPKQVLHMGHEQATFMMAYTVSNSAGEKLVQMDFLSGDTD
jgi:predicted restriction endonuclease